MHFFLPTYSFLTAIPGNSQIPPFVPRNLPSQNSAPEMQLKMTVIYLVSFHLGAPCPHLSKLSLFTAVPSEASRGCSEMPGFCFTLASPLELAELHGVAGSPAPCSPCPSGVLSVAQRSCASSRPAAVTPAAFHYVLPR